jgi:Flp pilus assembly protein TadB
MIRIGRREGTAAVVGLMAVGLAVGSPLLTLAPPVVAVMSGHRLRAAARRRRHRELSTDLPVYVDELIQRLKAGSSLAAAVRDAPLVGHQGSGAALAAALAPIQVRLAGGSRLGPALEASARGAPAGVDLLLSTLRVLVVRGGPALGSLERLSDTLRTARSLDEEIRSQAGQATASSAALTGLPVVFVAVMAAADRRLAVFYLHHPMGATCLLIAGGLVHLGWWWMDRLMGP